MQKIISKIYAKINFKNLIIFSSVLFCFFLWDWLTKYFIFDQQAADKYYWIPPEQDYGIIGFRSYAHANTTLFSFLKINTSPALRSTLNFILITVFTCWGFFSISKLQAIGLGIVVAGMFGNALDVLFTSGENLNNFVRDILYLPWLDRGTFNFADSFIVVGSGILFIAIFIVLWKDKK